MQNMSSRWGKEGYSSGESQAGTIVNQGIPRQPDKINASDNHADTAVLHV